MKGKSKPIITSTGNRHITKLKDVIFSTACRFIMPFKKKGPLICSLLFLLTSYTQTSFAQSPADEKRLFKAAFIYNFARFTRWPERSWSKPDSPIRLCTIGKDELVNDLKRLGGKLIKGHRLSIQPVTNTPEAENCHLLYIAISEKHRYKDILKFTHQKPILTISELPKFAKSEGTIQLYSENNQTRLIINIKSAKESELEISSRLLILAKVIVIGHEKTQ